MNWIDAIVEMKKDNSKVFQFGEMKAKIEGNQLIQYLPEHGDWKVRGVLVYEQKEDWVEVKQFKEVDYAEFMEWYCNPNNKGKDFKFTYKNNLVVFTSRNELSMAPGFILERMDDLRIPNE